MEKSVKNKEREIMQNAEEHEVMQSTDNCVEKTYNQGTFHELVECEFDLPEMDISEYSILNLAFVGDNVFDLVVRTIVLTTGKRRVNDIHRLKSSLVKAETQAWIADYLLKENLFTEEEADYFRRGKNAKTQNHAKNAAISEYHRATGLETVMGYLYLTNRENRIAELCKLGIDAYLKFLDIKLC